MINLNVKKTKNIEDIKTLILHEDIKGTLLTESNKNYENDLDEDKTHFYIFYRNKEAVGFAALLDISCAFGEDGIYCADVGLLKKARGKMGFSLGKMALKKIFDTLDCESVYAIVKRSNSPSFVYAKHLGFSLKAEDEDYYYLEVNKDGRST